MWSVYSHLDLFDIILDSLDGVPIDIIPRIHLSLSHNLCSNHYIGVAECLLRVYRSAAAGFRELLRPPQDQQRERAKDAVNGKRHFHKHWCDVWFTLFVSVCCADAMQRRSSGTQQRPPPLLSSICLFFTDRDLAASTTPDGPLAQLRCKGEISLRARWSLEMSA